MSRSFFWGKIIERDLGCAHDALLTLSFHMLFHSPPVDQQILDWIAFRLNSENSRVVTISPDAPWNACIVYDVMIQPSFFKCGISQYDIAYDAECLVVIGWCFSMWVFEDHDHDNMLGHTVHAYFRDLTLNHVIVAFGTYVYGTSNTIDGQSGVNHNDKISVVIYHDSYTIGFKWISLTVMLMNVHAHTGR